MARYARSVGETVLLICAALALAFAINLAPAFMPSTWMVMAFFYIKFGLPLLILTVGGAIASALGRVVLAKASTLFKRRFLRSQQSDLDELGEFLNEHRQYVGPAVFAYSLTPLPTNNLFIAAGMAEVNMVAVVSGFTAATVIANTFWVWTTNKAFTSLSAVFESTLTGPWGIALEVAGLLSVVLLFKLPWAKWLRRMTDGGGRRHATGRRQRHA